MGFLAVSGHSFCTPEMVVKNREENNTGLSEYASKFGYNIEDCVYDCQALDYEVQYLKSLLHM